MKIGFDGKRAVQNFTGLGNYSRYVVEALCKYAGNNKYMLYAPKERKNERLEPLQQEFKECLSLHYPKKSIWKKLNSLWRIWGVPANLRNDGVELFHGLSNELPLNIKKAGIPSIVTVHDLIFLRLPYCYRLIDRLIYNYKFRKACQNADHIIAVSECTKRDIIEFYNIPAEKISVIYQGCSTIFAQTADDAQKQEVCKRHNLPQEFILSVGSIEKRKNTMLAVKALAQLPTNLHLVLIGKWTPYVEELKAVAKQSGVENRLHIIHKASSADLPAIYQSATVFAYPSVYEGFGIPILEALYSRVPVVAAKGSCLEEAGGKYSLYVDKDDEKGMAEAIKQAMMPERRAKMIDEGYKWAQKFTMQQMAQETIECYKKVIAHRAQSK
ncbi:MAG: glycosyltransferase family 4 protein [Bacteroidaceae bacterium]|nr:glycosyltransferase family 4 protein [Bacteroidaceae bacterium]